MAGLSSMLPGGLLSRSSALRSGIVLAVLSGLGVQHAAPAGLLSSSLQMADLTRSIPARSFDALTGSQFADLISKLDPDEREQATLDELLSGNLPTFLRHLVPIELSAPGPHGTPLTATIFVTADYLAIGTDADFFRIPLNLHSALAIANRFGFLLRPMTSTSACCSSESSNDSWRGYARPSPGCRARMARASGTNRHELGKYQR